MRNVRIIRPKRMAAGALKLQVFVDDAKGGVLANGKEVTLSLDEGAHVISGRGGLMAGKGFGFQMHIPAGPYSYTFQVDMLSAKNGYTPVLRPTNGAILKDDVAVRTVMGTVATRALLSERVRSALSDGAPVRMSMSDEEWKLIAGEEGGEQTLLEQGYASMEITGGVLMQGIASMLDKLSYDTPEHRAETLEQMFTCYLNYLPDYEVVGEHTLRFKG